jgi:hypothetical protein
LYLGSSGGKPGRVCPAGNLPHPSPGSGQPASLVYKTVMSAEFTAVTDVHLLAENERHRFVQETLRHAGVVPMEAVAVWTAKLRPMIQ